MIIEKIIEIDKINNEIKQLKNKNFTTEQEQTKNEILQDFYKKNHIADFIAETKKIIKNV